MNSHDVPRQLHEKAERYRDQELKESAGDTLYTKLCSLEDFETAGNRSSYASFVRDLRWQVQKTRRRGA